MRLLGAALILTGFGAGWSALARAWRTEEAALSRLESAFRSLSARIRLTRRSLPRLLREEGGAGSTAADALLWEVSRRLERGETLSSAWRAAAEALPLGERVRQTVCALGEQLSGGEEEICKALSLASDCIHEELQALRAEKRDRLRRSGAVCFSAAALLIILLL